MEGDSRLASNPIAKLELILKKSARHLAGAFVCCAKAAALLSNLDKVGIARADHAL
jgi:hypothetical protein